MTVTISEAVVAATKDVKVEELKEISFAGVKVEDLEELTKFSFACLEKLSLSNIGLKSLAKCPEFPSLIELDIEGNKVGGEDLKALLKCPKLEILRLNGNNIADAKVLEVLKDLKHLKQIDVKGCELEKVEDYRQKIKQILEQVETIDGEKLAEDEDEETEDEDDEDSSQDGPGIKDLLSDKPLEDDEEDFVPPGEEAEVEGEEEEEEDELADSSLLEGDAVVCAAGGTAENIVAGKRKIAQVNNDEEPEAPAKK